MDEGRSTITVNEQLRQSFVLTAMPTHENNLDTGLLAHCLGLPPFWCKALLPYGHSDLWLPVLVPSIPPSPLRSAPCLSWHIRRS